MIRDPIPYSWGPDVPWLLRKLGCFDRSRRMWRFGWGEVSWRWGCAAQLCLFEDHYSLNIHPGFGGWFIKLPLNPRREPEGCMESWGFTFFARAVHLHWGDRTKVVCLPWDWGSCVRHDVLLPDGTWAAYKPKWRGEDDGRAVEIHPYRYVLDSGEVQHRTAAVYVSEMEWRWNWLRWLPWPRKISRAIDVTFDDEVGERSGSWKGGTLSCGYEMKRGETAAETLQRMQRDRKFR